MTDEQEVPAEVRGFVQGMKAASLAMRVVLHRKAAVGIITEETGIAILHDTGVTLDEALSEYFNEGE